MSKYARFSQMALQMGLTIGGSAWLGVWLDKQSGPNSQMWTVILSLSGVFVAMFLMIKQVLKLTNEEDE